ncbi:MAG: Gfo/Idh/MocA family oxidoreductase [Schleiferiaceae bacterium]|nr:Gfo/Idh/MocA family oxidoreductase [Schleiferiaceae bacterium]MDR9441436.1 Gfo/Idh/MocA family oxidoreductase [Schleiferiaceae bacterium]
MKLKIGVLGAGHLGKIHLKCLKQLPDHYEITGFYDPQAENAREVEKAFDLPSYSSVESLIDDVDVVDIVTPTLNHFEIAAKAARKVKHIFVEKPLTETAAQALELMKLAEEAGVVSQVGHVERFNPAYEAAQPYLANPMFVETHRLAEFNPRGTDVPVVLDLMIHDIDVVLSAVPSNVHKINASGVAVVSDTPDIANARLEFDNGCVANLTASRISLKNMRKTRFFQRDAYIAVDFLEKSSEVIRMKEIQRNPEDPYAMVMDLADGRKKQIYFEQPQAQAHNAIQEELRSFAEAINKNGVSRVTLEDGYKALKVAEEILSRIHLSPNRIS